MKYSMRNIGKAVSVFEVNFTDTDTGRKWAQAQKAFLRDWGD